MGEIIYNKLVRDNIPTIIKNDNQTPVTRKLNDAEYKKRLMEKLIEEAQELLDSDGDLQERADIAEVLRAFDVMFGYTDDAVEYARHEKAEKRGAFTQKLFLEKALTND